MKKVLLLFSFALCLLATVQAQTPQGSAEQIRAEIARRGFNPGEVEARMKQKGFEISNITAANIGEAQKAFDQVIQELEAEAAAKAKATDAAKEVAAQQTVQQVAQPLQQAAEQAVKAVEASVQTVSQQAAEEIQQKVQDGMGVQAAVAEALVDNSNPLPPSDIYGMHLFRKRELEVYKENATGNVPEDYVLGPGDKIAISVWGNVASYNEVLEVKPDGSVQPNNLPKIFLKGFTLTKARQSLRATYAQRYPVNQGNFEVNVSYSRTIDVTITGEVLNYGTFKLSALNTAFHALVACGGPSNIGTVRKITIFRANSPRKVMDVYAYLNDPTIAKNYYLENGDNIYVDVADRVVEIQGAVNRPMRYELIKGENLLKLIEWAGKLKKEAYLDNIQISRFVNQKREIIDVNLKDLYDNRKDFELQSGDVITIKSAVAELENFVEIQGQVFYPDRYAIKDSMRLTELLGKARLKKEAKLDKAYLFRAKIDGTTEYLSIDLQSALNRPDSASNIMLHPKDLLVVQSITQFIETQKVVSEGALRAPRELPFDVSKTMRVSDLVAISQGVRPDAATFGYITRSYLGRPNEKKYIRVNIEAAMKTPGSADDLPLEAGDHLVIPSRNAFQESFTAKSEGAVRQPREMQLDTASNLRVSNLIDLSDGLRLDATDFGYIVRNFPGRPEQVSYIRVKLREALANPNSPENLVLQPTDRLFVPSRNSFVESYMVKAEGALRNPKDMAIDPANNNLRVSNLVELSNGPKVEATDFAYILRTLPDRPQDVTYIRFNLKNALAAPGGNDDVLLMPNDRLFVPSKASYAENYTVKSDGAFRAPREMAIDPTSNLRVSNMVELSQGLKLDATDFGYIFRNYPDRPKETVYVRVDFKAALANPGGPADLLLEPSDRIVAMSKGLFRDDYNVRVTGAVRQPGEYRWDKSLTVNDLLTFAGGVKREAAYNRVDVFRVVFNQNQPTNTQVGTLEIDSNLQVVNTRNFELQPYDILVVRTVPEFELQKMVTVTGEVQYPGDYALINKNEKLASLIERAGGLSLEAFPEGATLSRKEGGMGFVVMRLKKALRNRNSRHNLVLKAGDVVVIPKQKDLVTIKGPTKAFEIYPDKIMNNGGGINVPHAGSRRAKFYIRKYAAGFGENADRSAVVVERPNGEIKRTKTFLGMRFYPKPTKGSVVNIGVKSPERKEEEAKQEAEKKTVNWDTVLAETLAKVTSIITLLVLIDKL